VICEKYGWTYEEYMNTPNDFLFVVQEMYRIETRNASKKNKKLL